MYFHSLEYECINCANIRSTHLHSGGLDSSPEYSMSDLFRLYFWKCPSSQRRRFCIRFQMNSMVKIIVLLLYYIEVIKYGSKSDECRLSKGRRNK